jgi:Cu/Ag efflux protein CusF
MIKSIGKLTLAAILAAMVVGVPVRVSAQSTTNTAPAAPAAKPKAPRFMGTLKKVDNAAKTITVENKTKGDRTFEITSETKITKDKKPATLADAAEGDTVSGTYTEGADGKMIAKKVNFAEKSAAAAPAPAK